jgi:hypothetical protein
VRRQRRKWRRLWAICFCTRRLRRNPAGPRSNLSVFHKVQFELPDKYPVFLKYLALYNAAENNASAAGFTQ